MQTVITGAVPLLTEEDFKNLATIVETTGDPEKKMLAETAISLGRAVRSLFGVLDQIGKAGPLQRRVT